MPKKKVTASGGIPLKAGNNNLHNIIFEVLTLILFLSLFVFSRVLADNTGIQIMSISTEQPNNQTTQQVSGIPIRIKIPIIGVDSGVERVGLTESGAMAVPKDPMNGGWYQFGTRPGAVGSAVIAGHVNWWNGLKGSFENIKYLKIGDLVSTEDDKGNIYTFAVREMSSYDADADATRVFTSSDGKAHLNLVTCEGNWITSQQQYSQRLVVFSDLVSMISSEDMAIRARVFGRILLQVEHNGEAWYVDPVSQLRYYMKDGATAYQMLRKFGLGITNVDLARLQAGDLGLIKRLKGRILLQVQNHGEAYYVDPDSGLARYMANGEAAYALMRSYSLGITNSDLLAIPVGLLE